MKIFTSLRLSAIVLLSFLFTASYAQKEEDYFITVWDLSLDASANSSIEFNSLTTGDVNYAWETVPISQFGSGKFSAIESKVKISNLPVNSIIKLKIDSQNLKRIYFVNIYYSKIIDVVQWGKASWSSMENAFNGCNKLNITAIDFPNLYNVKSMKSMFYNCFKFHGVPNFNQWKTQNVNNLSYMFYNAFDFNQSLGNWNTEAVTDMSYMFSFAHSFNQPIENWNTQNVINMKGMFSFARDFNQPLGKWNTQNVINMDELFYNCPNFNHPIGNWNTESVINMSSMFYGATKFNQAILKWNTSSLLYMSRMFYYATDFNQPIENWNTSKVIDMSYMFYNANEFNQPIGNWNTSNVRDMNRMFYNANSFNQRVDSFKLHKSVDCTSMLYYSGMNCKNYSLTLIGWANNPNTPSNIFLGATSLIYTTLAKSSRESLEKPIAQGGKGWIIFDDTLSIEDCGLITAQEEESEHPQLSLYPNPAQDKLFLKNATPNTAFKIIDGLGREVNAGTCEKQEISISALPSGLYTLRCGNRHFSFVKE